MVDAYGSGYRFLRQFHIYFAVTGHRERQEWIDDAFQFAYASGHIRGDIVDDVLGKLQTVLADPFLDNGFA